MADVRKRKSAADRRAEIVDTAIKLAADIGPDRVTTQHLADQVGVTQPAIFRHFSTKLDIWTAVGERIVTELSTLHIHPVDTSVADPHDLLHKLVGSHFAHVANNPAIPAILFSRELQAENVTLREKFNVFLTHRREAIEGLIHLGQAKGLHRAELVAEDAAHLLVAAMQGMSMRWLVEDRGFDLPEEGGRVLGALIDGFRT